MEYKQLFISYNGIYNYTTLRTLINPGILDIKRDPKVYFNNIGYMKIIR